MQKLIIKGKRELVGKISISGSKNATLPILAASILATQVKLKNIPLVKDIFTMVELLNFIGLDTKFLKNKNISIYSAILQESEVYYTCNFKESTAIVVGTESTGLSSQWRDESKKNIHIPMQGEIDSMNVSVAAGILLFEVKKQRNFN